MRPLEVAVTKPSCTQPSMGGPISRWPGEGRLLSVSILGEGSLNIGASSKFPRPSWALKPLTFEVDSWRLSTGCMAEWTQGQTYFLKSSGLIHALGLPHGLEAINTDTVYPIILVSGDWQLDII